MDVPSPVDGTVKEMKVKVGDKVSEGSLILTVESEAAGAPSPQPSPASGRGSAPPSTQPSPLPAGEGAARVRAAPAAGSLFRQGRHRVRDARARRGSRRLFRGVPQRRPRHEDRARRALRDARRRVPQRRLHSVEGVAAHGCGDGGSEGARRARHRLRIAADRLAEAAHVQGRRGQEADRRPGRHGEGAQGGRRARRRPLPRSASPRSRADDWHRPGQVRREEDREVRQGDHRCGQPGDQAAVHARRSARRGFDGRARAHRDAEAHARRRRRHHRPRDGNGVLGARRADRRRRDARRHDGGRRPRPRQGLGEDERDALRQRSC